MPAITRKTEKGLPRYQDATESDVFILSGAEDLVPVLEQVGTGASAANGGVKCRPRELNGKTYRSSVTGRGSKGSLPASNAGPTRTIPPKSSGVRSRKDNITTWYGNTEDSRIADLAMRPGSSVG